MESIVAVHLKRKLNEMESIVANDLKQNSQVLHICPPAIDSRLVKFFKNYCTDSIALHEDFLAKNCSTCL